MRQRAYRVALLLAERLPAGTRGRTAVATLAFGVAALLTATAIVGAVAVPTALGGDLTPDPGTLAAVFGLPVAAALGGAVAGGPAWWLAVERRDRPTLGRGIVAGAAAGTLSHPVMWVVAGIGAAALVVLDSGLPPLSELSGAVGALVGAYFLFTIAGFVLTGVLTVPAGAATGAVLAYVRARVEDLPYRRGVRDW